MLAVNQENEQLMEEYEKLASDVGIPGFDFLTGLHGNGKLQVTQGAL